MIQYTVINHIAKEDLGLTLTEYCLADSVYHLSNNPKGKFKGWCYASRQALADFLSIEKRTIYRLITSLVEKGILEKEERTGFLKTTEIWYKAVIEVTQEDDDKVSSEDNIVQQDGLVVKMTSCHHNNDKVSSYKNKNNNKLNRTSSIVESPKEPSEMETSSLEGARIPERVRIVEEYIRVKGLDVGTSEKKSAVFKRCVRAADAVVPYGLERCVQVMEWLEKNADFKWTLETVGKYAAEDLSKLEEQVHARRGEWKCDHGHWHKRGEQCGHGQPAWGLPNIPDYVRERAKQLSNNGKTR